MRFNFILFILLSAVAFIPDIGSRAFYQSAAGLALVTIFIGKKLYDKYGIEVGLAYALFAVSFFYQWPLPQLAYYSGPKNLAGPGVQSAIESAVLTLTLMAGLLVLGKEDFFIKVRQALLFLAVVDSGFVIVRGLLYGSYSAYFILSNSATDASFLACFLPIAGWFSIPILIAIALTKSSTGFGAVGVVLISWLMSKHGLKKTWPILVIIPLLMWGVGHFFLQGELFNSNGRFYVWRIAYEYWSKLPGFYRAFGTGAGSFFVYGPVLMKSAEPTTSMVFFWMHNDWLQVLFENGWTGLSLVFLVFLKLMCGTEEDPKAFAMLCTFGFIGLTQMPLRQFLFQVLGVCFIGLYGKGPSILVADTDDREIIIR